MKTLEEVARNNLKKIRENARMNQERFAQKIGLKRTTYTKKEHGKMAILLSDLDKVIQATQAGLNDVFEGHYAMDVEVKEESRECPSKKAGDRFPFLRRMVSLAEDMTTLKNEDTLENLKALRSMCAHGIAALDKMMEEPSSKHKKLVNGNLHLS